MSQLLEPEQFLKEQVKNSKFKLTLLGAARNVTGSQYLIEFNNQKVLVDCGLYQERELKGRNWAPFAFSPRDIDTVLLTHAHLDHCGLLPRLVREGLYCPVYCTAATAEIAQIMLLDSANLLQEDAAFKKRRHERERRKGPYPEIPLYTTEDAKASFPLLSPVEYGKAIFIGDSLIATLHDAGHVLGSAMIKLTVGQNGAKRIILFSGDIGRWEQPILRDPTLFAEADLVLMESTYGDRFHEPLADAADELRYIINRTVKEGGNIVIPSFAFERAQEILYYLNKFLLEDSIPHLMVFVDSPMAVSITEVFEHHPELFDEEMVELLRQRKSPFDFPGLSLVKTVAQSKAINQIKGSVIIMAGSGMCTGGRIKHHLVNNIVRGESTILFVGYQAAGTLGRQIVDGAKEVRILGQYYPVKAKITQLNGFSAHADRDELVKWISSIQKPPHSVFITHGEPETAQHFASLVKYKYGWNVSIPQYRDEVLLD